MGMEKPINYQKYIKQSYHYLQNAQECVKKGEIGKASEFLWGGAAEAVKAFAARKGIVLKKHGDLWEFILELSTELKDRRLYEDFQAANNLHRNFYEIHLEPHEFLDAAEQVKRLVFRLFKLIKEI
jgi:hypothetical protein